jgi:hypothetical protein
MPEDRELAVELLRDLCDDLLDVQIGTLMFWSPAEIREDHFAEYVQHWLLKASREMGWQNEASSKYWEA